MTRRISVLLSVFFFSVFTLFAQSYSYADLQNAMMQNNPDLLKLEEEYARSVLDVKDAKAGLGPSIDLQVTGTYMFNPPVDAIYLNVDDILNSIQWPTGTKPSSSGQYVKIYDGMESTLYNFSLSMQQTIFTWGKLYNAVKLYEMIADVKKTQLTSQQQQKETELETRLVTVYYLNQLLDILEEEKEYATRLVQTSENAEKSGMLLHQDVVDARIRAKELEIGEQDVNEQLLEQLLELRRVTGIEDLSADNLLLIDGQQKINAVLNCDRKSLEEQALSENQLSIKMLSQLREIQKLAEKISKGYENWKPDVAMQVDVGYGGSRVPLAEPNWLLKDDYTANISIGIKTTIWDGGKKLNDVARKKSEVKTADINELDAQSTIKKTLSSQWNTVDLCNMKIEYQDLKIEAADSKIKQQETVYSSGYGSETDVLTEKIDKCNQLLEKKKQELSRAAACIMISYLGTL